MTDDSAKLVIDARLWVETKHDFPASDEMLFAQGDELITLLCEALENIATERQSARDSSATDEGVPEEWQCEHVAWGKWSDKQTVVSCGASEPGAFKLYRCDNAPRSAAPDGGELRSLVKNLREGADLIDEIPITIGPAISGYMRQAAAALQATMGARVDEKYLDALERAVAHSCTCTLCPYCNSTARHALSIGGVDVAIIENRLLGETK
jgi:hypothetical protein